MLVWSAVLQYSGLFYMGGYIKVLSMHSYIILSTAANHVLHSKQDA
jgi:hypothetical protein